MAAFFISSLFMHLPSYLRSAEQIIGLYDGAVPFAAWLKAYFKQHKKFGSRDRKMIADLCFCFYRLGGAFAAKTVEEQLLTGQALCHSQSAFVDELMPEWKDVSALPVAQKFALLQHKPSRSIFPFLDEVSREIDTAVFNLSHLIQPDLFLRIRPGKSDIVCSRLQEAAVPFSMEEAVCVRLPNNTKIDEVIALDSEAVVQDKSSQRVLEALLPATGNRQPASFFAWEPCAASGGKSILLHDLFPQGRLTVSDIRQSILHNLRSRFKRAGISSYQSFVADVSSPKFSLNKTFDLIICDAPCSGSGTWGRTPEHLRLFQKEKIEYYASLQKAIAVNASRCVKKDGAFLYITCSVFAKENEEVVEHITQQTTLRLGQQQYIKGYGEKADTLFVALFTL